MDLYYLISSCPILAYFFNSHLTVLVIKSNMSVDCIIWRVPNQKNSPLHTSWLLDTEYQPNPSRIYVLPDPHGRRSLAHSSGHLSNGLTDTQFVAAQASDFFYGVCVSSRFPPFFWFSFNFTHSLGRSMNNGDSFPWGRASRMLSGPICCRSECYSPRWGH